MKRKTLALICMMTLILTSCGLEGLFEKQIGISTQYDSTEVGQITSDLIDLSTVELLKSSTPISTLNPTQTKELLQAYLQNSTSCELPCFLGVIPGETTQIEAYEILASLGVNIFTIMDNNQQHYSFSYNFSDDFSFSPVFTIDKGVVEYYEIFINPETQVNENSRKWMTFSPESLIKKFGEPSGVEFSVIWGGPNAIISMLLFFEQLDMIIEYNNWDNFTRTSEGIYVCPLIDQQNDIRIWIGNNSEQHPINGVPIDKATDLTIEEFSKLMLGQPKEACFYINESNFFIE